MTEVVTSQYYGNVRGAIKYKYHLRSDINAANHLIVFLRRILLK